MKKLFLTAAFSLFAALVISCGSNGTAVDGIVKGNKAEFDSLSYAVGVDMANGIKNDLGGIKLDWAKVNKTIEAAAIDKKSVKAAGEEITSENYTEFLNDFFRNKYGQRVQKVRAMEAAKRDTTGVLAPINPDSLGFNAETMFASEEERELISSALGYDLGTNLSNNANFPLQLVWLFQAVEDVENGESKMDVMVARTYLNHYFSVVIPAKNKEKSVAWLAEVEKQSGVKKTASGLLYKITEEGDAATKPAPVDTVKVHYKGTTRTGKVFDASRYADMPKQRQEMLKMYRPDNYMDDEPVEFPLNGVIKGWTEGLQLIGKGGKITLWIPSELAYGERGAGRDIAANEALCFEVELLDVAPAVPVQATPEAPAAK